MKVLIVALAALAAGPAAPQVFAQADAKLAPGGIADGAEAGIDGAEGTAPDGRPAPGGQRGRGVGLGLGQQAATSGSEMVKQGDGGDAPKSEAPNEP